VKKNEEKFCAQRKKEEVLGEIDDDFFFQLSFSLGKN